MQYSRPVINIRELNSYSRMKAISTGRCTLLNQQLKQLLEVIQAHTQPQFGTETDSYTQFTQKNCEEWVGLSNVTIRRRLARLVGSGVVEVDESSKPYKYRVKHQELNKVTDLYLSSPQNNLEHINSIAY